MEQLVIYLMAAGAPFELVEDVIDAVPIEENRKLVLWLLAMSELPRALRCAVLMT